MFSDSYNIQKDAFVSIRLNDLEHLKTLINHGLNLNVVNQKSDSLLHLAAELNKQLIVDYLLSLNIDVNMKNNENDTALHIAAYYDNPSIITSLINAGADLDIVNNVNQNAFTATVFRGNLDSFYAFTQSNKKINFKPTDYLLNQAARINPEMVEFFLQQGEDINAKDYNNETPLIIACSHHKPLIVEKLLNAKADINVYSSNDMSPFLLSVTSNNLDISTIILNTQLVSQEEKNGALLNSSYLGHTDHVSLLLNHKANINCVNAKNSSSLHLASYFGNTEIVKLLLMKGINTNIKDVDGLTAFEYIIANAKNKNHEEILEIFKSFENYHELSFSLPSTEQSKTKKMKL